MPKKIACPRGTLDILPQDSFRWYTHESLSRILFNTYNYKEIRTPVFEDKLLFLRSLGDTSDVVNKQLLQLASDNKDGFALRPEGTAPVVRAYIENSLDRKAGLHKFFYIGPMFRGERPQKGRLRQFHQIGVEVIGPEGISPLIDAEVIALAVKLLHMFGLTGFEVKINSLGTTQDKEKFSAFLRDQLRPFLPDMCEDCQNRFDRNVFRLLDCKQRQCQAIVNKLELGQNHLSEESQAYFKQVTDALDALKIAYSIDPCLVRGLDYYTHTVFEITGSSLGSQDALGAGGRYNNLVAQLGGPDVSAVGFALGMERILLSLPQQDAAACSPVPDIFLVVLDEEYLMNGFVLLQKLRDAGVAADMCWRSGSMKAMMRQANKSGAGHIILIGADEAARGVVTLKNMETGNQQEVAAGSVERIVEHVHKAQAGI